VTGYWVARQRARGSRGWTDPRGAEFVPADQADLLSQKRRFSQSRGTPALTAAMGILDKLDSYIDAETLAAEMQADWAWFIKRDPAAPDFLPGTDTQTDGNAPATGSNTTYDKLLRHEPGMVYDGTPGEELNLLESKRPSQQFEPYIVIVCRIVGASIGLPLELLLLDFSRVNYTSGRMGMLQAVRRFRWQQRFVTERMWQPYYRRLIARAIARRELPARSELFRSIAVLPQWPWTDPFKDAAANRLRVEDSECGVSDVIRERGGDPAQVRAGILEDRAWFRANDIPYPERPGRGETPAAGGTAGRPQGVKGGRTVGPEDRMAGSPADGPTASGPTVPGPSASGPSVSGPSVSGPTVRSEEVHHD
jgi:capsid protein